MTENETAIIENDEMIAMLEGELKLYQKSTKSDDWLVEWKLGKIARFKEAREAIKKRRREMLDHIDAEERALFYKWGKPFKDQVDEMLLKQGGKKKSVKFLTGQAGYRKTNGTIIIEENQMAIDWAVDNLSNDGLKLAIATLNKTPLIESVTLAEKTDKDTGEMYNEASGVPSGCRYLHACDKFYPYPPTKLYLPEGEKLPVVEG